MFAYRANSFEVPSCVSSGVNTQDCQTTPTSTSCDDPVIPCPGCEEQRIAELETIKDALQPGDEQVQTIAHEQQSIYREKVNSLLEDENTGLDDAIAFTENVEALTDLDPVNKAALLLLKSEGGAMAPTCEGDSGNGFRYSGTAKDRNH
ncbi:MAG: hypothetical protein IPK76_06115 [Lewinellaceae bacterium]|nr:hypothetical protein [Lewinellaceae bacterium]